MKKTLMTTTMILALCAGVTQAGLLTPGNTYDIRVIDGVSGGVSCFSFGDCDTIGTPTSSDNNLTVNGIGSGIAGDGFSAIISITADLTGDGFSVNSYSQDAYINTAAGTLALRDIANGAGMSGSLDDAGNMTFDATGRTSIGAFIFQSLGELPLNIDDAPAGDGTNAYDIWTTGTMTANATTTQSSFTMTGVPIAGSDSAGFTGQLVTAGNIGTSWGGFVGTQYSERFELSIVNTTVPVPAAAWLFSSGLLALFGATHRNKQKMVP